MEMEMKLVGEKYDELFERVAERLRRLPGFHNSEVYRIPREVYRVSIDEASLIFHRRCWYSRPGYWPSGLFLGGVFLNDLTAQSSDPPCVGVFLRPRRSGGIVARPEFRAKAERFLSGKKVSWTPDEKRDYECGWYPLPEPREKLLEMLRAGGGEPFVKCMADHVLRLKPLIPVLDQILLKKR